MYLIYKAHENTATKILLSKPDNHIQRPRVNFKYASAKCDTGSSSNFTWIV